MTGSQKHSPGVKQCVTPPEQGVVIHESWYFRDWLSRERPTRIPESHNSGTYGISILSSLNSHLDSQVKALFDHMGQIVSLPFREIVKWWSITQHLTTYQQLEAGVRYLDIRMRKFLFNNL